MRRREFIITLFAGATYTQTTSAKVVTGAIEAVNRRLKPLIVPQNGLIALGSNSELVLPENVVNFSSIIRIEIEKNYNIKELPRISGGKLKIMGDHEPLEFDKAGIFTFQYSGDDMGWILV